jgi:hypothetical protein
MGRIAALAALLPLATACAGRAALAPAVAPALPPASWAQVTVLDPSKEVFGTRTPALSPSPCVIDLRSALSATPEAREFREKGYPPDSAEYHILLHRANERLRAAIRRVAARHGYDRVLELGSVVLRPEVTDAAVADITPEVSCEVARQ